jgi:hypothetical protein
MAELQDAVAALTSRTPSHEPALGEANSGDLNNRALESMSQAIAALSTRSIRSRADEFGSEDDNPNGVFEVGADVPEMRVADPQFASLLSVNTYLLTRRSPRVLPRDVSRLTKRAAELRPRLGSPFDGSLPLSVLPFLQRVKEIAEEAGLTEGIVLRIFPDLLSEAAVTSYRGARPDTYPAAIKWFLLTYAPESRVAERWRDLQQLRQEDPETATEFALRLQRAAHQLGGLVSSVELKSLYEGGLQDSTRHLFRATLPPDPARTLSDSVAAAEALSQAVQATRGERSQVITRPLRTVCTRGIFALPEVPSEAC